MEEGGGEERGSSSLCGMFGFPPASLRHLPPDSPNAQVIPVYSAIPPYCLHTYYIHYIQCTRCLTCCCMLPHRETLFRVAPVPYLPLRVTTAVRDEPGNNSDTGPSLKR